MYIIFVNVMNCLIMKKLKLIGYLSQSMFLK